MILPNIDIKNLLTMRKIFDKENQKIFKSNRFNSFKNILKRSKSDSHVISIYDFSIPQQLFNPTYLIIGTPLVADVYNIEQEGLSESLDQNLYSKYKVLFDKPLGAGFTEEELKLLLLFKEEAKQMLTTKSKDIILNKILFEKSWMRPFNAFLPFIKYTLVDIEPWNQQKTPQLRIIFNVFFDVKYLPTWMYKLKLLTLTLPKNTITTDSVELNFHLLPLLFKMKGDSKIKEFLVSALSKEIENQAQDNTGLPVPYVWRYIFRDLFKTEDVYGYKKEFFWNGSVLKVVFLGGFKKIKNTIKKNPIKTALLGGLTIAALNSMVKRNDSKRLEKLIKTQSKVKK